MTVRTIIIDDEPLSIRVIEKYLANFSHFELLTTFTDAIEAFNYINHNEVDLIFLDINMPKLSGISFAKSLKNPPLIIFVTAYPEFAVEGFELDALDYLLKPFSFERFLKATKKVEDRLKKQAPAKSDSILIKSDKKLYKVAIQDILYLQAYGDYVKVFTKQKLIVTKRRLSNLEQELPDEFFQRIHRSYIVALDAVEFIEGNQVYINDTKLPIAATYHQNFLLKIKNP